MNVHPTALGPLSDSTAAARSFSPGDDASASPRAPVAPDVPVASVAPGDPTATALDESLSNAFSCAADQSSPPSAPPPSAAELLDRLAARAERLYSLPAAAVRVLELARAPEVDAAALKDCIEQDPALAARVLRVVNSALFGLSQKVTQLPQALALLGVKPLQLLVLGFSLPKELFQGLQADVLGRYWRHALTKAAAAREISQRCWRAPGDEAFLAGLLQDIGVLPLAQELGPAYWRLYLRADALEENLAEAERAALGFSHVDLTERLLTNWGLPARWIEAVAAGRETPRDAAAARPGAPPSRRRDMAAILELAELAAQVFGGRLAALPRWLEAGQRARGLSVDTMRELAGALRRQVDGLAEAFSLELPDQPDFRDLLIDAQEQLALLTTQMPSAWSERARAPAMTGERASLRGALWAAGQQALRAAESAQARAPAALGETTTHRATVGGAASDRAASDRAASDRAASDRAASHGDPRKTAPARAQGKSAANSSARSEPNSAGDAAETPRGAAGRLATPSREEPAIDPGLLGRLEHYVARCRDARQPLSLALVEIDRFRDQVFAAGWDGAQALAREVEAALAASAAPGDALLPLGEDRFAWLLPGCERGEAVEHCREVAAEVRRFRQQRARGAVALHMGVATLPMPAKNFPAIELARAAERCLQAARLGGGCKSIDIY